ncbi:hypothetical protein [Brevibacterium moorei]|uniref:hypothetical protein n=1 Tax=Brevibacterium moorei TaxID=2968457 RepID=UPI00211C7EAB|nr:hypothetical protein [Brevibacterium sp. 68QC2CO]MCQ9384374.1 hypothetical protein [Brevibacterium sp. 68QC2CO]
MMYGEVMPGGRPKVTEVSPEWEKHLKVVRNLHAQYMDADLLADTVKSMIAEDNGIKPSSVTRAKYPEYAKIAKRRERIADDRAAAMQAAVDAGVSMYRIAKECGFKSGSAHVANVLKGRARTRARHAQQSSEEFPDEG